MILTYVACYEYYATGSNIFGKLGLGTQDGQKNVFTQNPIAFSKVELLNITAGVNHALAVTEDHKLFGWGYNSLFQLGTSLVKQADSPIEIDYFSKNNISVVMADGGTSHSIALSAQGEVFTWGYNMFGQLIRDKSYAEATPTRVLPQMFNNEVPVEVAAQYDVSFVLTSAGHLFAYGRCTVGGLCGKRDSNRVLTGFDVAQLFVGENNIFIKAGNGSLFGSGANPNGQLCADPEKNDDGDYQRAFKMLTLQNVDHVAAGRYHTLFTVKSQVYGCGLNTEHQMGPTEGTFLTPTLIYENPLLRSVAACSEGSLFLTGQAVFAVGIQLTGELGLGTVGSVTVITQTSMLGLDLDGIVCRQNFAMAYSFRHKDPGANVGMIVGFTVGGVVILAGLAFLMFLILKHCNKTTRYTKAAAKEEKEKIGTEPTW